MNKYHAQKTKVDGYTFDSKAEARRYSELVLLQRGKHIVGLAIHPSYALIVNDVIVGKYTPDFAYRECNREVVEDVKGHRTKDYIFRAKVFRACYPKIELREIGTSRSTRKAAMAEKAAA